jgi:hypothetical protein
VHFYTWWSITENIVLKKIKKKKLRLRFVILAKYCSIRLPVIDSQLPIIGNEKLSHITGYYR